MLMLNHSLAMDMAHMSSGERGLSDLRLHREGGDTLFMRKERDLLEWEEALTAPERALLEVTRNLYLHYPLEGGCYHMAFFLALYLKDTYGINGEAVVGFVNDGISDKYYSHAWYVAGGRITDIAISRPVNPRYHWRGALTIMGREIVPGWQWSYHTETSQKGIRILKEMQPYYSLPPSRKLHLKMSAIAKSPVSMRLYLEHATAGYRYDEMAKKLDELHCFAVKDYNI